MREAAQLAASAMPNVEDTLNPTKAEVIATFHGKSKIDSLGRSWCEPPKQERREFLTGSDRCYVPKEVIHTYTGHQKAVHRIRFSPNTGHLLLSASFDQTVKIWDVFNNRKCLMTYAGHTAALRDVQFTHDGHSFYSCAFDNLIRKWDVETGKLLGTALLNQAANCIAVHPTEPNTIVVGCNDSTAKQFDFRMPNSSDAANMTQESDETEIASLLSNFRISKPVQEYKEHLGAVNAIALTEGGRRMLTSGDDKKVFLWEFGIPVVRKHFAEPHQNSMPYCTISPNGQHVAWQSLDSRIVIYEAMESYRVQHKRSFRGYGNAGYALGLDFSPDNKFICTGDAGGRIWFWDFESGKTIRTLTGHQGVCIQVAWHPNLCSRLASCGWDGTIKLWD